MTQTVGTYTIIVQMCVKLRVVTYPEQPAQLDINLVSRKLNSSLDLYLL